MELERLKEQVRKKDELATRLRSSLKEEQTKSQKLEFQVNKLEMNAKTMANKMEGLQKEVDMNRKGDRSVEKENEALKVEVQKLKELVMRLTEREREAIRRRASGMDESSIVVEDIKKRNFELFDRLAAEKSSKKSLREELGKRDSQICLLTEHIEKLMNALKLEASAKKEAQNRQVQLEGDIDKLQAELEQSRSVNKTIKKHAATLDKQDKVLEKQLQLMDSKYSELYHTHQQEKAISNRKEKQFAMQVEHIANFVWQSENKIADALNAKTNTLLGVLKLYESLIGQMSSTVIDLQECMLGDAGARALSRAIQATLARQVQRKEAGQQLHRSRFAAWQRKDRKGPIPFNSNFDGAPKACVLNLSYNGITDKGVKALAVALAKCKQITEVDLRGNLITKRALPYITDALTYNGNIEAVDLSGNRFSKADLVEYVEKITNALQESVSESVEQAVSAVNRKWEEDSSEERKPMDDEEGPEFIANDIDPENQFLRRLPVLTSKDKSEYSAFRYKELPRPRSAPPRCRTTRSERSADVFLPVHAYHSNWDQQDRREVGQPKLKQSDVLRKVDRARLYPPQKTPYSALARITVDTISSKKAQEGQGRIRPRPESAIISRDGGQEYPSVARATAESVMGRPTSALAGVRTTASGKIKFGPSKIKNRLQVHTSMVTNNGRPSTAPRLGSHASSSPMSASSPTSRTPQSFGSKKKSKRFGLERSASSFATVSLTNTGNNNNSNEELSTSHAASTNTIPSSPKIYRLHKEKMEYAPSNLQCAFSYARKGNVAALTNLMKKVEPNALVAKTSRSFHPDMRQNHTGETVVMHAARNGQGEIILVMIEEGANLNALSNEGWSALHHAVDASELEAMDLLLQYGCDVNCGTNFKDGTPLHLAIRLGKLEAVCKLLSCASLDIHARDSKGRTPLHIAVMTGKKHMVKLLRQQGAQVRSRDKRNQTPISYAEEQNDIEIQEALLC